MYAAGPRVEKHLLERAVQLDDSAEPIAETYRLLRSVAEQMGVPRPSYERVRTHLRVVRRREADRRQHRERVRELALHLAFNTRPAAAVAMELFDLAHESSYNL